MRFSSPSHLHKQGVAYYFRITVPDRLKPILGRAEVKKSLSTVYLREAKLRVVQVSAVVQGFLGYLDVAGPQIAMTPSYQLQAHLESELNKVSAYWKGPEESVKASHGGYLPFSLPKVQPGLSGTVQPQQAKATVAYIPEPVPIPEVGYKLSEAVDKYISDRAGKWRTSSKKDIIPDLKDFVMMVGDIRALELSRDHMRTYQRIMHHLPKRRTVDPKYKRRALAKILSMSIPEVEKLSATTLGNSFTNVRSFINWLEDEGLVQRAATLNKMLEVQRKNTSPGREPFTEDELRVLFSPKNFRPEVFRSSWQFWLPIMGLYTGARLEELCQLHLSDIRKDEASGVWYLSINCEGDKKTKTSAGNRSVPIHPVLVELGLLDRVEALRRRHTHLFPTLELRISAGKLGGAAGQWFTRYRRQCGVGADKGEASNKVFHSLRHTFITRCLHLGLVRRMYQEVVGHEKGAYSDVTAGYEGKYPLKVLYDEVVGKLDFKSVFDLAELTGCKWVELA